MITFVHLIFFQLCATTYLLSKVQTWLKKKPIYYFFIIKEYLENMERYKKRSKDYL